MKTNWSKTWNRSVQPRKQRKYLAKAPAHVRQKLASVHLDKTLREKYSTRTMPLRKGDEVKIVRGSKKNTKGKVASIDLGKLRIYIEGQTRESVGGKKVMISFNPSNLMITDLKLGDSQREQILSRKSKTKSKPEEKSAPKTTKSA